MTTLRKPRNFSHRSPAVVILNDNGVTVADLALLVGYNESTVSRQLSGQRPLNGRVAVAIRDLIGEPQATRLFAAIPPRPRRSSKTTKRRRRTPARSTIVETKREPTLLERVRRFVFGEEATA